MFLLIWDYLDFFLNNEVLLNVRIMLDSFLLSLVMAPLAFRTKITEFFVLFVKLKHFAPLSFNSLSFHSCIPTPGSSFNLEHFLFHGSSPFYIF